MEPTITINENLRQALIQLGAWRMFMENTRQQNGIGFQVWTVSHAFTWSNSPQGHDYWSGIYKQSVRVNSKLSRDTNVDNY